MRLENKVAIVTGGAGGIGFGCSSELAKEGAAVAVADRPGSEKLSATEARLRETGAPCLSLEADAFTREGCEGVLQQTIDHLGDPDILVHVPAFNRRCDFLDYPPEDFEAILQTALLGAFHMGQLMARHLVERKKPGKIVFISSPLARLPNARCVAYSAAKAGLESMVRTMAVELCGHHVNVNAIEPGWTDTPGERQHYDEETLAAEARELPMGRMLRPEEIGKAAAFLASADADAINGTSLPVDGLFRLKHCRDVPVERD